MGELHISILASDRGDLSPAFAIRRAVFIAEQGVAEAEEMDGQDAGARHYLARLDGAPVGTARLRDIGGGAVKIERVAILAAHRGNGHGGALMRRILSDLAASGARLAVLNAQLAVADFYAALGFAPEGELFIEAGIEHIRMTKPL